MSQRTESPSSLNTYYQCPRKYWYHYIKKLPSGDTIHTVRGNAVHDALEIFFTRPIEKDIDYDDCERRLVFRIEQILTEVWNSDEYKAKLKDIKANEYTNWFYFQESVKLVKGWASRYAEKVLQFKDTMPFVKAFNLFAPISTEREYTSDKYKLMGKIDAIHKLNGDTFVKDYKTSKSDEVDEKLKLQAAIYALLYFSTYKNAPDGVIFDFLKFGEVQIDVDKEMLNEAIQKIRKFHEQTKSVEEDDYPKYPCGLCKWKSGECDYYSICDPYNKKRSIDEKRGSNQAKV